MAGRGADGLDSGGFTAPNAPVGIAARRVFAGIDLAVFDVRCRARAGDAADEFTDAFEVVLPVAGVFRRRTAGGTAVIDAAAGYVAAPGQQHHIAHSSAGDRCIALLPRARWADELGLDMAATRGWAIRRGPVQLRALARAWEGRATKDALAAEEAWTAVLAALLPQRPPPAAGSAVAIAQHRAVTAVREALAADPGHAWTLRALGRVAGYAPHHLSRVFAAHCQMTVTEYRDAIRLTRAVAMLGDGVPAATVAARLGFADHSHLTRRLRRVGATSPSALRPRRR